MKVHTYLNFEGQAQEAFDFYRSVFGGEFIARLTMADGPESQNLSETEREKIMHISLPIGDDTVLMASDMVESAGQGLVKGNNVFIMLSPTSREEADYLFKSLSEDGDTEMNLQNQFWGDFYGSLTDRFGVKWMVNFRDQNEETMKELEEPYRMRQVYQNQSLHRLPKLLEGSELKNSIFSLVPPMNYAEHKIHRGPEFGRGKQKMTETIVQYYDRPPVIVQRFFDRTSFLFILDPFFFVTLRGPKNKSRYVLPNRHMLLQPKPVSHEIINRTSSRRTGN
ncbi:VOC family protein [Pricia sp.]|uniref:VOC family protein n=1 Tax=Pricia sp. TaxID=2268138 RepID=UPI003593CB82